jgi:hypothetical protein
MATVPNILDYTSNANNLIFLDCKFMPYFFDAKGSVMNILKDSIKDSIDFSFKLYNRVVLINNEDSKAGNYAKIYVVSFSPDNQIESLSVAYVNAQYKEGKPFSNYLNDAKNNKNGLTYASGYVKLRYIEKPEYLKEDLVRQMLQANLQKGQPYSFELNVKTQEYSFYKINHNEASHTCTQSGA